MPTPCSIPGCRTNRTKGDPACSVFGFPKEPVRLSQWLWAIHQLYDPTYTFRTGYKVCSRHFEENLIEKEHRAVRDDGSILTIPRKSAALVDSAVPTLFDFLPDPHPSASGAKCQMKQLAGASPRQTVTRRRRTISSLSTLRSEFPARVQKEDLHGWQMVSCDALPALSLYKIQINDDFEPEIKYSVTVKEDLSVKVVHPEVSLMDLYRVYGEQQRYDDWGKLFRLLHLLDGDLPPGQKRCRMKVFEKDDVVVLEISHPYDDQSIAALSDDEQDCDSLEIHSDVNAEEQEDSVDRDCNRELEIEILSVVDIQTEDCRSSPPNGSQAT